MEAFTIYSSSASLRIQAALRTYEAEINFAPASVVKLAINYFLKSAEINVYRISKTYLISFQVRTRNRPNTKGMPAMKSRLGISSMKPATSGVPDPSAPLAIDQPYAPKAKNKNVANVNREAPVAIVHLALRRRARMERTSTISGAIPARGDPKRRFRSSPIILLCYFYLYPPLISKRPILLVKIYHPSVSTFPCALPYRDLRLNLVGLEG